jgi:hypothetical protein
LHAREHNRDRRIQRRQLIGDRVDLVPRLERPNLAGLVKLRSSVLDPAGGVRLEKAERHGVLEDGLERAERIVSRPRRQRCPPRREVERRQLVDLAAIEPTGRVPKLVKQLLRGRRVDIMRGEVTDDELVHGGNQLGRRNVAAAEREYLLDLRLEPVRCRGLRLEAATGVPFAALVVPSRLPGRAALGDGAALLARHLFLLFREGWVTPRRVRLGPVPR